MLSPRTTEILEVGYKGSLFISDTTKRVGKWSKIVPTETTQFTALVDAQRRADSNSLSGEDFPANYVLTGDFTEITLASGAIVAYV